MSLGTVEIKMVDAEIERFKRGHEKCGLHDDYKGLISTAASVGLSCLEKINFDIGGAITTAARRPGRKGGAQ